MTDYYNRLGTQFYDRGEYVNAYDNFKKSIQFDDVTSHPSSHYYLGMIYKKKNFPMFDEVKSRDHFVLSSKLDYDKSYFMLGLIYEKGLGRIGQNIKKAIKYYEQGVGLNNHDCLINLGVIYDEGKGVRKDQSKSFSYFKRAASLGDVDANYNLALMYENGEFVSKNVVKAMRHYCDAGVYPNPDRISTVEYISENQIKRCKHYHGKNYGKNYGKNKDEGKRKKSNSDSINELNNKIYEYINKM